MNRSQQDVLRSIPSYAEREGVSAHQLRRLHGPGADACLSFLVRGGFARPSGQIQEGSTCRLLYQRTREGQTLYLGGGGDGPETLRRLVLEELGRVSGMDPAGVRSAVEILHFPVLIDSADETLLWHLRALPPGSGEHGAVWKALEDWSRRANRR